MRWRKSSLAIGREISELISVDALGGLAAARGTRCVLDVD
jgi:hypothetical protein